MAIKTKKVYGKHSRKYSGKHAPKRTRGVYYTTGNPFELKPFKDWAKEIKLGDNFLDGERHIVQREVRQYEVNLRIGHTING